MNIDDDALRFWAVFLAFGIAMTLYLVCKFGGSA